MISMEKVVTRDPEILGGEPVFAGTRVPIKSLFDHVEAGDSIPLKSATMASLFSKGCGCWPRSKAQISALYKERCPSNSRIWQTSSPEKVPSLGTSYLKASEKEPDL